MTIEKAPSKNRTRNYASILYPESAPADWRTTLSSLCVQALVSPLHDKDINEADEEAKKEHYHVMIMFENVKTKEQADDIFKAIGAVKCKPINSLRGYARYLCHMDNPEKAQYDPKDVEAFSGADYKRLIGLQSDKYTAIREMISYCKENDIRGYDELMEYSMIQREDWFTALCDNATLVMKEYLKSRTWTKGKRENDF